MARTLNVFIDEQLIGRLDQDDSGALWFSYSETWLNTEGAFPLSTSLPLRRDPYRRNECRPFFAGLLPEESSRELISKIFGVSDKNDFALLERIGAECAGAVSLIPSGELPMVGSANYRDISDDELAGYIAALPQRPLLAGQEGIRLSLAGAQGKLAIAVFDGKYYLPLNGSPSTHIIKPQGPHFEGLVDNEYFCMRLAARSGLDVAPVAIGTAGPYRFLQVGRYDRKPFERDTMRRIHQEDFCQALGIPPEWKYQQEGGPNLKTCFELIRTASSAPGPDVLRLFDAVVFNYLIGNNDAHGKNFSLLYDQGKTKLAPLYDLVCTMVYPTLMQEMAMKIGGERKSSHISGKNWLRFFHDAGLGPAVAAKRLKAFAANVSKIVRLMDESSAGWELISPIVLANCARVISLDIR